MPRSFQGSPAKYPGDRGPAVTWALDLEPLAILRTVPHNLLIMIIGFQRLQRTDRRMSYAKDVKKAQCANIETTIRECRLLFAG